MRGDVKRASTDGGAVVESRGLLFRASKPSFAGSTLWVLLDSSLLSSLGEDAMRVRVREEEERIKSFVCDLA